MNYVVAILSVIVTILVGAVIGAAVIKFMWGLCGMEEWLGLTLPWGPAFFIALITSARN